MNENLNNSGDEALLNLLVETGILNKEKQVGSIKKFDELLLIILDIFGNKVRSILQDVKVENQGSIKISKTILSELGLQNIESKKLAQIMRTVLEEANIPIRIFLGNCMK